jgi:hypothetical protein
MTTPHTIDAQVMVALPDDPPLFHADTACEWHIDKDPAGDEYGTVIGVALTAQYAPRFRCEPDARHLTPGTAIAWPGDTIHARRINTTPEPRLAIYGRIPERLVDRIVTIPGVLDVDDALRAVWLHIREHGLTPGYFGADLNEPAAAAQLPDVQHLLRAAYRMLTWTGSAIT